MKKCTGVRCLMQAGTVDPDNCGSVEYCPQATPPETSGPTVYELQILANQVTIMGALAVIFPEKGDMEILQNMLLCAENTRKMVLGVMPKEADNVLR